MEDTRRVKFNVGGRIFEMTWATLKRIPTLFHMMTDQDDELFVDRSPKLFEEVFAFVVDEKHPFPLRYSYELDWYHVVYDKKLLVDDEAALNARRYEKTKLMFAILQNGINQERGFLQRWSRCVKTDCEKILSDKCNPLCDKCIDRCLFSDCTKAAKKFNYCKEHRKTSGICNEKGCFRESTFNHKFCCKHWPIV